MLSSTVLNISLKCGGKLLAFQYFQAIKESKNSGDSQKTSL